MKRLTYLAAVLCGLMFWFRPPYDPDLGWHLMGGAWVNGQLEQQLSAGRLSLSALAPRHDFINSFSPSWHDYHWLGQLLLFKLYALGGYDLLQIALALLAVWICKILIDICRGLIGPGATPAGVLVFLLPAAYLLYDVASVRPQMLAVCGLALALRRLLQPPSKRELALLFALSALLANVHVYWIFVPVLFFCYRCLPRLAGNTGPGPGYAWGGLLLLLLSAGISPYGIFQEELTSAGLLSNYAVLWDYLAYSGGLAGTIAEFKSPFARFGLVPVILLVYFAAVARFISIKRLLNSSGSAAAGLLALFLSIRSVKFVGPFAVLGLPWALLLTRDRLLPLVDKYLSSRRAQLLFMTAGLAGFALLIPKVDPLFGSRAPLMERYLPLKACEALADLNLPVDPARGHIRVLTYFDYGGWCRWAAYLRAPGKDIRVTSDGRTQGVPNELILRSFDLYNLQEGWAATLTGWSPDAILAGRRQPLSHVLFMLPGQWEAQYRDSDFAVFVPKGAKGG